jgi:hypothetical protein
MLRASSAPMLTEQDQLIFETLVPPDHYLRQVNAVVDFERYRATMAACYHASMGRSNANWPRWSATTMDAGRAIADVGGTASSIC